MLTYIVTAVISAAIGVLGYIAAQFIGKPILEIRKTITEVAEALALYANVDIPAAAIPQEPFYLRARKAQELYRQFGSRLPAQANDILFYGFWAKLNIIPSRDGSEIARANLFQLSNETGKAQAAVENSFRQDRVREALRIRA